MISDLRGPYDILAIGAHPDDAELFAGGTLALAARQGLRSAILSLTQGERGTRGTPEDRHREAVRAAEILAVDLAMLDLPDGELADTPEQRSKVATALRRLRPRMVLTHVPEDRHFDHGAAHALVKAACFLANMGKAPIQGDRHQVEDLLFFLGNPEPRLPEPDLIVDVTETFDLKLEALRAYATQFSGGRKSEESPEAGPPTLIASGEYWEWIEVRARFYGRLIGARYGEPFVRPGPQGLRNLRHLPIFGR